MKSCILLQSLIADTRLLKIGTQKRSYPKDHWTLKTGYFEDPNPATQVRSPFHWRVQDPEGIFKKWEMILIVALLSLLRKLIHPMWCSKCRWFESSEVCIVCIGLPHPKNPVTSRPVFPIKIHISRLPVLLINLRI